MTAPYGLLSDLHTHTWSQFATVGEGGINSRLQIILDEINRAAAEVEAAGGNTLVLAGDLFHTRGAIAPEVFNPVQATFSALCRRGFLVIAIPGNHDLAGKDTTTLGNAMQTMAEIDGFRVITESDEVDAGGHSIVMVPWIQTIDALKKELTSLAHGVDNSNVDLIIHAGIDGVLSGVPAHGLPPSFLAELGFKRVFAGDYHHHCSFEGGVYSIGATTHQTYSDIGTKAGFLLVHPDRVQYRASHAPSFVEVTADTDPEDVPAIVDGNYVRVRSMKLTDAEVNAMRSELVAAGARGVSFMVERVSVSAREGSIVKPASSLEESVAAYVTSKAEEIGEDQLVAVQSMCGEILREVKSVVPA